MSEEAQFAWLKAPLRGFFESAASMAGVEIHVTVDPDAPPVGFRAIEACGDRAFWVQTHLLGDPEALVGLILGDELVRILGSKVLMLPDVSDEVTDEIEMAFDEVVNVGIGTWNRDVDDEDKRWDNGVAARSTRRVHLADGPAASLAYRVAGATISFEGKAYPVALAGTGSWLPAAAQVTDAPPEVDAPKDPKAPKKEQELPPLETVSPRGGAPRGAGPASPQ
ncbi:MAG: hypothetical protein KC635_22160, partial [Myxococcales bacterium]|nr:hypothetical protein [Myxococcales bacterium]